jgi:hypothetical protein
VSRPIAFEGWLKQNAVSVSEAALILSEYARTGDSDNLVWYYLELTGDKTYTPETFIKAARIAVGMEES